MASRVKKCWVSGGPVLNKMQYQQAMQPRALRP